MRQQIRIYLFILSLVFSVLPVSAQQKQKNIVQPKDSIPFFRGVAVSADAVGLIEYVSGDHGQFEAAVRVNLKDKYFPVFEVGYGMADHDDDVTKIKYKTKAPYARIGVDFNVLKNKHDIYKLFCGLRYGFTSFDLDVTCPSLKDPVWGNNAAYGGEDIECSYHWVEAAVGLDAKIWGPLHLGWSLRYRQRISYDCGDLGECWYVPGYGKAGSSRIGGMFYVTINI